MYKIILQLYWNTWSWVKEFDVRRAHDCTASKERTKSEMIFIYILITHFSECTISYTVYQYVKLIISLKVMLRAKVVVDIYLFYFFFLSNIWQKSLKHEKKVFPIIKSPFRKIKGKLPSVNGVVSFIISIVYVCLNSSEVWLLC